MEKRIFIAILASVGFLWLWAAIAPKLFPDLVKRPVPTTTSTTSTTGTTPTGAAAPASGAVETAPTSTTATTTAAAAPNAPQSPVAPVRASAERYVVHDTSDFTAVFTNRGAQLISYKLKHYDEKGTGKDVELVRPILAAHRRYPFSIDVATTQKPVGDELNDALYEVTERSDDKSRTIEFRYASPTGARATKSFRFGTRPFLFDFSVELPSNIPYRVAIGPGIRQLPPNEAKAELEGRQVVPVGNGVIQSEGDFELLSRDDANTVQAYQPIDYIGVEDNYFLAALRPHHAGAGVLQRVHLHDKANPKLQVRQLRPALNSVEGVVRGEAYFGPKETHILDGYGFGEALQFGWFGVIARFFLTALLWINQYTHNYGWAIVVLTILIKIALYPLQHKSIVSMKKMQRVQPKMETIKAKYKKARSDAEQRQKMNVEMMQLYQKEGINPMAGCFPILLQMPILFGFYGLLSRAIELRGADFMLWIKDLSEKDPYYVTPILMTITMFIQTYITPSTGDPMQRRMFLIMPFIFGFFFKDFPSGLVLYWLVQNILTIIQQMIMNKWWKDHPEELAKA